MKKAIHLSFYITIFIVFHSCIESGSNNNDTTKDILISGNEWFIGKPKEWQTKYMQVLKFGENQTISIGETTSYDIVWVDDNSFKLSSDGKVSIFKCEDENEKGAIFKVAILSENEEMPSSEDDWLKLHSENRVLRLYEKPESVALPDFYIANGKEIPSENVPPAGSYKWRDWGGQMRGALKVIIINDTVKFQTGENFGNLEDTPINDFNEDGTFELKDFMFLGSYQGDGLIEFFTGANGASEEDQAIKYINESRDPFSNPEEKITEYIERANDYPDIRLYSKKLTGIELTRCEDNMFLFSVVNHVMNRKYFKFHNISLIYRFVVGVSYTNDILMLNGPIKEIETREYRKYRGETSLKERTSVSFDKYGGIKSILKDNLMQNDFHITYHSIEPIKYKSIAWNNYDEKGNIRDSEKFNFIYNEEDVLQRIDLFDSYSDLDYNERGTYYISYFEKGILIGRDFYSIMKTNPSIPYEYYENGSLKCRREIDSQGNQYVVDPSHGRTVYDKNNKILSKDNTRYFPNYYTYGNFTYLFSERDHYNNWTVLTNRKSNIEEEIYKRRIYYY